MNMEIKVVICVLYVALGASARESLRFKLGILLVIPAILERAQSFETIGTDYNAARRVQPTRESRIMFRGDDGQNQNNKQYDSLQSKIIPSQQTQADLEWASRSTTAPSIQTPYRTQFYDNRALSQQNPYGQQNIGGQKIQVRKMMPQISFNGPTQGPFQSHLSSPTSGESLGVSVLQAIPGVRNTEASTHQLDHDGKTQIAASSQSDERPSTFAGALSSPITGFGIDVMKAVDEERTGNTVVSPLSIATVLALLLQGSAGTAQQELSRALRLTPLQAREQFNRVLHSILKRNSRNILKIATNIFVGDEFVIDGGFKRDAIQYFGSDVTPVSFRQPQRATAMINSWVATRTQGFIKDLVTEDVLDPSTQLVLANAVFFKGLWNSTFSPERTVQRPFTLGGGTGGVVTAPFMHNGGKFRTGQDQALDAQWVILPFEGLQYSLIVLVSSATQSVSDLLQRLTPYDIARLLAVPQRDATISLPKFNIRVDTDLTSTLKKLGIRSVFGHGSGLTGLGGGAGGGPAVSAALHAGALSVDERGGSAAAATALAANTLSLEGWEDEFHFRADRPFLALLWDSEHNLPLFIAKITDPTLPN